MSGSDVTKIFAVCTVWYWHNYYIEQTDSKKLTSLKLTHWTAHTHTHTHCQVGVCTFELYAQFHYCQLLREWKWVNSAAVNSVDATLTKPNIIVYGFLLYRRKWGQCHDTQILRYFRLPHKWIYKNFSAHPRIWVYASTPYLFIVCADYANKIHGPLARKESWLY